MWCVYGTRQTHHLSTSSSWISLLWPCFYQPSPGLEEMLLLRSVKEGSQLISTGHLENLGSVSRWFLLHVLNCRAFIQPDFRWVSIMVVLWFRFNWYDPDKRWAKCLPTLPSWLDLKKQNKTVSSLSCTTNISSILDTSHHSWLHMPFWFILFTIFPLETKLLEKEVSCIFFNFSLLLIHSKQIFSSRTPLNCLCQSHP